MQDLDTQGQGAVAEPLVQSICWQAAIGRDFCSEPPLVAQIRGRLIDAHRIRGRRLIAYVLLRSEIQTVSLVQPPETVQSVARSISGMAARWVRRYQPVRSPVFAGPYRARMLATDEEVRREALMLAWRPVHLGLCRTPSHYAYGFLRPAIGRVPAHGFDTRPLLRLFGSSPPPARAAMQAWLEDAPSDEQWREWELTHGLALPVRDEQSSAARAFSDAAAALVAAGGTFNVDGALKVLEVWVAARLDPKRRWNLHEGSDPMAARGRALVACLAVRFRIASASAVARHYARAKATLSEQMTRCRARPADRQLIAMPPSQILEEARALMSRGPES